MNTKLHALCNGEGRPLAFTLTEGQVSDYKGAKELLASMPPAQELLADRGYDATWFREELLSRGITPCIPSKRNRKDPTKYNKILYKQRHKIEIMFGRLKDGEELPCDTTDVFTPSIRQYVWPLPSSFTYINES